MDRKQQDKKRSKRRKRKCVTQQQQQQTTTTPSNQPTSSYTVVPQYPKQNIIPLKQYSSMTTLEKYVTDNSNDKESMLELQSTTNHMNDMNQSHDVNPLRVIHRLPPTFSKNNNNMICPDHGFLRNVIPYQKSFQHALQTSYEGFVVDMNVVPNERILQETLQSSEEMAPFFVTDVTQPFGLGTKCTPTYVTRCLMGDVGTTYKYLGLRMFAHPWNDPIHTLKEHLSSRVIHQHLPQLYQHRQATTTTVSDSTNTSTTTQLYTTPTKSSCFDICLINRMTMNSKLKTEPLDEDHKITVSWHADSSLEHYSTIAVYQTIVVTTNSDCLEQQSSSDGTISTLTTDLTSNTKNKKNYDDDEWSIGLRVSPNVEGPKINSSRNGNDDNNNDDDDDVAPPIAVSLPTNSAYYLLDDFNHHHQHTVLVHKHKASISPSIRYSLTFRLLRDSHNVNDMIHRCQRCVSQFHKKGTKTYRFEQLTLNELESEWLRQFYIQGRHHYKVLWDEWCTSFMKLWEYWNQLEERTFHTIQLIGYAAEGRCFNKQNVQSNDSEVTDEHTEDKRSRSANSALKPERKQRAKRKKAVATILELLKRESASIETAPNRDHTISLYESFASVLEERATLRELWLSREADPIFKKMSEEYRPIPFPARFGSIENSDLDESIKPTSNDNNIDPAQKLPGRSPMPGTSVALRNLARTIRLWGFAFLSCDSNDLPAVNPFDEPLHKEAKKCENNTCSDKSEAEDATLVIDDANCVSLNWDGWTTHDFGLEMQYPWSRALLDGRKSIEVRRYDLPSSLLGRKIYIIETPVGKDGVSAIVGNHFHNHASINEFSDDTSCEVDTTNQLPRIVGWTIFSTVKQYKSQTDFCIDEKHHIVPINSAYGWQNGDTNVLFGWVVSEYGCIGPNDSFFSSGLRRFRSLFQLALAHDKLDMKECRPSTAHVPDLKRRKAIQKKDPNSKNCGRASSNPTLPKKKRRY